MKNKYAARQYWLGDDENISIYEYFQFSRINGQPRQAKAVLRDIIKCGEFEKLQQYLNELPEEEGNAAYKFIAESMIVTI